MSRGRNRSRSRTRRKRRVSVSSFRWWIDYSNQTMSSAHKKSRSRRACPRNHARKCRRRLGLTQIEVGFLLGGVHGNTVYRYESGRQVPTLRSALACEIILGVPARELFPDIHEEVEHIIRKQARKLIRRLRTDEPDINRRRYKISILDAIITGEPDAPHRNI